MPVWGYEQHGGCCPSSQGNRWQAKDFPNPELPQIAKNELSLDRIKLFRDSKFFFCQPDFRLDVPSSRNVTSSTSFCVCSLVSSGVYGLPLTTLLLQLPCRHRLWMTCEQEIQSSQDSLTARKSSFTSLADIVLSESVWKPVTGNTRREGNSRRNWVWVTCIKREMRKSYQKKGRKGREEVLSLNRELWV